MALNIKRSSWHARVFKWYFQLSDWQIIQYGLCPYFWGWLLIIPTAPLFLVCGAPAYLFAWIETMVSDDTSDLPCPAAMAAIGLLGSIALFITGSGVWFFVKFCFGYKLLENQWTVVGVDGFILLVVLICWAVKASKRLARRSIYNNYNLWFDTMGHKEEFNSPADWDLWRQRNRPTSFWTLIGQGIKAFYKRACPVINWS